MIDQSAMTLGSDWEGENPSGWLMSEKLDGCRAYWNGARLWTRGGCEIEAPPWLLAGLPAGVHLDGELWAGRGRFTVARLAAQYGRWTPAVRFMVFDLPTAPGTWPERLAGAKRAIVGAPAVSVVQWRVCRGRSDLRSELARVLAAGGEGIMLRAPAARGYETGRTRTLLKVKGNFLL